MPPTSFAALGVPAALCARLDELGITEPFPVQAATLPDALAGRDVCGKAPTGSGKTIAFGLPLLARVQPAKPRKPTALVLVPTRELASQVEEQLNELTAGTKTRVLAVYGGAGMQRQMRDLQRGVEVVVATPGRLKDLLDRGSLRLDDVHIAVVDEADRMADMGFLPEVRRLLDKVRTDRQTLLFSATLDGDVDVLIRNYQHDPAHHEAESMEEQGEVTHRFWRVSHGDRIQIAAAVCEQVHPAIVFSRTRHGAERLSRQLTKLGVPAEAIHGDRSQNQREKALAAFGRGQVSVLVATDVAARGIHVDGVACVLQFDPPATDKDYVHRAGRTGRAGAPGTVINFVTKEKEGDVRRLQRELRRREPIEDATAETAATVLTAAAPKPMPRGDDLDGVSRRERARADLPAKGPRRDDKPRGAHSARIERDERPARPAREDRAGQTPRSRKPHRKGQGPTTAAAPSRGPKPASKPGRPGAKATAGRPGRPSAKPGGRTTGRPTAGKPARPVGGRSGKPGRSR
jgi:superfamily II DNA/RNA helicase